MKTWNLIGPIGTTLRRFALVLAAGVGLGTHHVQAAIPVGVSGSGTLTFDTLPAASEWATGTIAGTGATATSLTGLDTLVNTLAATGFTTPLATLSADPTATTQLGQWNSAAQRLTSKAGSTAATGFLSTLQNTSGAAISNLAITFTLSGATAASEDPDLAGYALYYSLTGATGSWQRIGVYGTVGAVTTGSVALTAAWADTATLYVLWVDDNGNSGTDGWWGIDDVSFVRAAPEANILTFGLPGNPAVISGTDIALTVPYQVFPSGVVLSPAFTLSGGASCTVNGNPVASGAQFDFTSPVHYIVTSSDSGITKDYTVTVTVRTNPAPTLTGLGTSTAGGTLGDFDLTALGTTDWVTFSKGNNSNQVAVANRKTGGTAITNIASSAYNGGTSLGGDTFSYTNGTSPTSASAASEGAMIKMEGSYRFFSFRIDISNKTGFADVWYSAQQATTGTLSVTDGFTTLTKNLGTDYGDAASRKTAHDRINFTGATGDTLTVTYSSSSGEYNGRIGLDAVALTMADTLVQSTECDMLSFGLPGNPAVINGTNITLTVPYETVLSTLAPVFTQSLLSTCNQTSGSPPSPAFSTGLEQHYIVTAENMAYFKDYIVTVVVSPPSTACDIITFGLPGNPAVISGTDITLTVPAGTNLATLAPVFTKSAFATCNQPSGSPPTPDFSTGLIQHYLVTAQDNNTFKDYAVTVIVRTNAPPTLTTVATSAEGGSLGDFNLTTIGTSDWVTFSKGNNSNQVAVANRKTGGTSIANLASSAIGGGASLGGDTFSYTNGTPTASAAAVTEGASINLLGGSGFFSFKIDISNKSGYADIWYSVQLATSATLSVTDGFTTLTSTLGTGYNGGGDAASRKTAHDRIAFTGASGDMLTVTYTGDAFDYGGKIGLDAVAVAFAGDPVPTPGYGDWASTKGLSGEDAAFDADPDKDGISNGIEFVLGGEPNPANPNSNSASLLPAMQTDGDNLVFIFTRTDDSAYLNPTVEFSNNLMAPWTTAVDPGNATITVVPALPVNGSPAQTVTVTIPKNGATRIFARLKVVQPTP